MADSLKPRTTKVILFQGDDLDVIEAAQAALSSAQIRAASATGESRRMVDPDPVRAAAEEYDRIVGECAERGVEIEVHALPRKKYRELVLKHEPREDNETDAAYGFNSETMADDLVPLSVPREYAGDFLDELSDADFSTIYGAAVRVNQGRSPDPKARASSLLGPTGDES